MDGAGGRRLSGTAPLLLRFRVNSVWLIVAAGAFRWPRFRATAIEIDFTSAISKWSSVYKVCDRVPSIAGAVAVQI